jgi:signal transduction histidine kinase
VLVLAAGIATLNAVQSSEAIRLFWSLLAMAFGAWSLSTCSWMYYVLVLGRDRPSTLGPAVPLALHRRLFIARVHPDDREAYATTVTGRTPDNPTYQTSYRMLCPDGGTVWLEESGHVFFNDKGRMLRTIGMVVDTTEQKLAEEALASVGRRLIEAQEKVRYRIARELHDDLARLAMLSIELEQLRG